MKKGLIGVQMSTIAPAKMPSFDAFDAMKKLGILAGAMVLI